MVPVSYTHLDVYKRQAPGRANCRRVLVLRRSPTLRARPLAHRLAPCGPAARTRRSAVGSVLASARSCLQPIREHRVLFVAASSCRSQERNFWVVHQFSPISGLQKFHVAGPPSLGACQRNSHPPHQTLLSRRRPHQPLLAGQPGCASFRPTALPMRATPPSRSAFGHTAVSGSTQNEGWRCPLPQRRPHSFSRLSFRSLWSGRSRTQLAPRRRTSPAVSYTHLDVYKRQA